jgi:hypothetical protein
MLSSLLSRIPYPQLAAVVASRSRQPDVFFEDAAVHVLEVEDVGAFQTGDDIPAASCAPDAVRM